MKRRAARTARTEAIEKAALALFVEQGVRGATTRAIARRARTTEGNLYRYYPSKQELARRVITSTLVGFGESIAAALDGVAGPRHRLRAFVRAYLGYALAHPDEHALVVEAHNRDLAGIPEEVLRPRRILVDILADGGAAGVFAPVEARVVAPFIAGGLARAARVLATLDGDIALATMTSTLADSVERLVGAVPAAPGTGTGAISDAPSVQRAPGTTSSGTSG